MTRGPSRRTLFGSTLAAGGLAVLPAPPVRAATDPILRFDFIYDHAPYPQCHASTLVETRDGGLAAAWFGGTQERAPDVCIWFTRLSHLAWETPVRVASGMQADGTPLPTWNPVLFQDPAGPLLLFYKVGPSPAQWWGMVVRSDDGGRSWGAPQKLPAGVLGPIKNKPIDLKTGRWISPSSSEGNDLATGPAWRVHFERSDDRGQTWTRGADVASPLGIDAIQPTLFSHPDGRLQAVCRTRQGALTATWSHDDGLSWSPLAAIDLPNPNSGIDGVTLADGRHLLVYNHAGHFAERPGAGPRYPVNIALSEDGTSWRQVLTLESHPLDEGYAYPAVIQTRDGRVHISYTWDRKRIRYIVLDPTAL